MSVFCVFRESIVCLFMQLDLQDLQSMLCVVSGYYTRLHLTVQMFRLKKPLLPLQVSSLNVSYMLSGGKSIPDDV